MVTVIRIINSNNERSGRRNVSGAGIEVKKFGSITNSTNWVNSPMTIEVNIRI